MQTYDKGDKVRCIGTFTNAAGAAVDPTVVLFKWKLNGMVTTLTYGTDAALVKSATGIYYVDIDADTEGIYHLRFYSTGVVGKAAVEGAFQVRESEF